MKTTINPNITVETAEYSALEDWVAARGEQQRLEKQVKKIKGQIKEFELAAQIEALEQLADVNNIYFQQATDENLVALIAEAKIKTFEFNPLFKIQVSFTTKVLDDEELHSLETNLEHEQLSLEKANQAKIDVLEAKRAVLDKEIAALRTSPKIAELQEQVAELRKKLTLPVVKSMALKKA